MLVTAGYVKNHNNCGLKGMWLTTIWGLLVGCVIIYLWPVSIGDEYSRKAWLWCQLQGWSHLPVVSGYITFVISYWTKTKHMVKFKTKGWENEFHLLIGREADSHCQNVYCKSWGQLLMVLFVVVLEYNLYTMKQSSTYIVNWFSKYLRR